MSFPADAGSARDAAVITPADGALFTNGTTRALYVGVTGDLTVITQAGNEVTFANVPAGSLLPIRVTSVQEATTASSIVGLW